jgi:hypothetical protein
MANKAEMERKLQQRKLDALKRGIHRVRAGENAAFGVHVIGLGQAGCEVVAQTLTQAPESLLSDNGARLTALAVDVDPRTLQAVQAAAAKLPPGRAQVETLALEVPSPAALQASLNKQREFLQLEYPLYAWNPNYQPWVSSELALPKNTEHFPRAVAKALYSKAYYDAPRTMASALRRFAQAVDATEVESVVCIVFALAGGTGSALAVDLARHLSNAIFGHRVVVVGIGIAPCAGDAPEHDLAQVFPVLTELDCMADEAKNAGVTTPCGDLHRNPFTGGFLLVPQQHVWAATQNLRATHERVDRELAALLVGQRGTALWETLKLLNWVAAPSTQHSAARTPFGAQWLHLWSFADSGANVDAKQLGVRATYRPEFIELRAADPRDAAALKVVASIDHAFKPEAAPVIAQGTLPGSVQFVLPRLRKTDLDFFFAAQSAYATQSAAAKLLQHAWLLELGIVLCEPSTRLQGMAGASLWGGASWVAVPYDAVHIPDTKPAAPEVARAEELSHAS